MNYVRIGMAGDKYKDDDAVRVLHLVSRQTNMTVKLQEMIPMTNT